MLCTDLTLVKYNRSDITAEPLRCRSWQCEHCRPLRRKRCIREAAHGDPETFITLTANPAHLASPDERARALVKAWREVVRRAKKKYGYKTVPFYAVFEKTKRGEPHLHILCRLTWIDQGWLSSVMNELTTAPICDVRRIDKGRAPAKYIAKYLGKDLVPFQGVKRYWRSLDWLDTKTHQEWLEEIPQCDIEVWRMSFYDACCALRKRHEPLTIYQNESPFVVRRR